jgi:hypothetical protein
MSCSKQSVLLDLSAPIVITPFLSRTTCFRRAFTLLQNGHCSIRHAAKTYKLKRKQLKNQYKLFIDSKVDVSEWVYVSLKRGRKPFLNSQNLSSLRIAAHTMDSIGHPVSRPSLNQMIQSLNQKESRNVKKPAKSTLRKWQNKLRISKKAIRNGCSARSSKSQVEFIVDFGDRLHSVVSKYSIKKKHM